MPQKYKWKWIEYICFWMKIVRILLLPISFLYGTVTWIRNILFDVGILSEKKFKLPIIAMGNLNVGGTGKTPHIEYLIDLLVNNYQLATLSRGYGRITSGYRIVSIKASVKEIGDEPRQIKQKFKEKIIGEVKTSGESPYKGIHTFSRNKNSFIVDLKTNEFFPFARLVTLLRARLKSNDDGVFLENSLFKRLAVVFLFFVFVVLVYIFGWRALSLFV